MTGPKVTNAPDSIYLCYGDIEDDCTHAEVCRDGEVTWCEDQPEDSDIKYIRSDIVDALRVELAELKLAHVELLEETQCDR